MEPAPAPLLVWFRPCDMAESMEQIHCSTTWQFHMAEIRLTVWKPYDNSAGDENESDLSSLRILLEGLKNNWLFWIYINALGYIVYGVEHVIFHHRDLWAFVFKEKARAYAHNIYIAEQPCKLLIVSWLHFVHGTSTLTPREGIIYTTCPSKKAPNKPINAQAPRASSDTKPPI